jgi:hypothetical protein
VAEPCFICAGPVEEDGRRVLVRGKRQQVHCSEACLLTSVRRQLAARATARRRWSLRAAALLVLLLGVGPLWQHTHAPGPHSISIAWPAAHGLDAPAPEPIAFGPPWPPTDEQWIALFDRAAWTHPLPGPVRRSPTPDARLFGPEPPREQPARCRTKDHCVVDLGGELWGEHVYASLDGIVERVQNGSDRGGGISVRLVHFGGTVYTQFFHLAATPRGLTRGTKVSAGDVIGLLGDTGLDGARRHLGFALSVRPSSDLPEVYWDATPWLGRAALRLPPHGTVAGFAPSATRTATPNSSFLSVRQH